MRKTEKKILAKVLETIAFKTSKAAANSSCACIYHQPKLPESVKNLRKF